MRSETISAPPRLSFPNLQMLIPIPPFYFGRLPFNAFLLFLSGGSSLRLCRLALSEMSFLASSPPNTPVIPPLPGVEPNFVDPYNKRDIFFGVRTVLLVLVIAAFSIRVTANLFVLKSAHGTFVSATFPADQLWRTC